MSSPMCEDAVSELSCFAQTCSPVVLFWCCCDTHLTVQDLRIQCRQRGLSPAGSKEDLAERLKDHMRQTKDLCASCLP